MKKILLISFVFILVLNLILAVPSGGSRLQSSNDSNDNSASNLDENATNPRIGGNKDEHGCLIPAGYSWNATEQKCVREWSNGTDRYQNNSGLVINPCDIVFRDDWVGGGYGQSNPELLDLIRQSAKAGYYFDPTYSGKAMQGLVGMVRRGEISEGSKVLFWHTGGIMNLIGSKELLTSENRTDY